MVSNGNMLDFTREQLINSVNAKSAVNTTTKPVIKTGLNFTREELLNNSTDMAKLNSLTLSGLESQKKYDFFSGGTQMTKNFVTQSFSLFGGLAGLIQKGFLKSAKSTYEHITAPKETIKKDIEFYKKTPQEIMGLANLLTTGTKEFIDDISHPIKNINNFYTAYKYLNTDQGFEDINKVLDIFQKKSVKSPSQIGVFMGNLGLSLGGTLAKLLVEPTQTFREEPVSTLMNLSVIVNPVNPKLSGTLASYALKPVTLPIKYGAKALIKTGVGQQAVKIGKQYTKTKQFKTEMATSREIYYETRTNIIKQTGELTKKLDEVDNKIIEDTAKGLRPILSLPPKLVPIYEKLKNIVANGERILTENGVLTPEIVNERIWMPIKAKIAIQEYGKNLDKLNAAEKLAIESKIAKLQDAVDPFYYAAIKVKNKGLQVLFPQQPVRTIKPSFLKKYTGASEWENLQADFYHDPFQVITRSQLSIHRFLYNKNLIENLLKSPEVKRIKLGEKLPSGYKVFAPDGYLRFFKIKDMIGADDLINILADDTLDFSQLIKNNPEEFLSFFKKKDLIGITKKVKLYVIPNYMANEINKITSINQFRRAWGQAAEFSDYVTAIISNPLQAIYSFRARALSEWKKIILGYRPTSWIKNNLIGNLTFSAMQGIKPTSFSRGLKLNAEKLPKGLEISFARSELNRYIKQLYPLVPTTTRSGKLMNTFMRTYNTVPELSFIANDVLENFFRRASFYNEASTFAKRVLRGSGIKPTLENVLVEIEKNPVIQENALKTVNYFFGNWAKQSAGLKAMSQVYPFIRFYAHIGKLALSYPLKYPARGLLLQQMKKYLEVINPNIKKTSDYPDYLQEVNNIPFEIDNKKYRLRVGASDPFTSIIIKDLALSDFANQLSPDIKIAIERITRTNLWRQSEFTAPKEYFIDKETGKQVRPLPPLLRHITNNLPYFRDVEELIDAIKYYRETGKFRTPVKYDVGEIIGTEKHPKFTKNEYLEILKAFGVNIIEENEYRREVNSYKSKLNKTKSGLR